MLFVEKKDGQDYKYTIEDLFGKAEIISTHKLDAKRLDKIIVAILKSGAGKGEIAGGISFTVKSNNNWDNDEETV